MSPGPLFFVLQKWYFGRHFATFQTINSDLHIKFLRPCRNVIVESDFTKILPHCSFKTTKHDHVQVRKQRKQSELGWAVLPNPPHSPDLVSSNPPPRLEPSDLPFVGKGLGLMTRLLSSEELAAGTKFKLVQKGTDALVSRRHKAADFYGDHVTTLNV